MLTTLKSISKQVKEAAAPLHALPMFLPRAALGKALLAVRRRSGRNCCVQHETFVGHETCLYNADDIIQNQKT